MISTRHPYKKLLLFFLNCLSRNGYYICLKIGSLCSNFFLLKPFTLPSPYIYLCEQSRVSYRCASWLKKSQMMVSSECSVVMSLAFLQPFLSELRIFSSIQLHNFQCCIIYAPNHNELAFAKLKKKIYIWISVLLILEQQHSSQRLQQHFSVRRVLLQQLV